MKNTAFYETYPLCEDTPWTALWSFNIYMLVLYLVEPQFMICSLYVKYQSHSIHVFFISVFMWKGLGEIQSWKLSSTLRWWITEGFMSTVCIPQQWFTDMRVFFQVILYVMRSEASFPNSSGKKLLEYLPRPEPCLWSE